MADYTEMESDAPETVMGPKGSAEPRNDTFFLPQDFPGSEGLKPGDTITLKVVGKDSEGDIEVAMDGGEEEMSMADDLRQSMGSETGPEEQ